ncbi:MAG: homoserine kinase [Microbacteriaceae bacterium]|nr:homoserine kinase [Microbacteriaceae bacterium]
MSFVKVFAPATSANLGPGFDSLGMAFNYGDTYTAQLSSQPGVRVTVTGDSGKDVPSDHTNLVAKTLLWTYDKVRAPRPAGIEITCENVIPHGRGLGSSSAATVGGLLLAKGLLGLQGMEISERQLLDFGVEIEGHPDNIAPCLLGGLVVAWMDRREPGAQQLQWHENIEPLLLVPNFTLSTEHARSLQPDTVPLADACFNVSRAALLVAALTHNPEHLLAATEDRLHQDYRAGAMQASHQLLVQLREKKFAAVVSGAGPSLLVLCKNTVERQKASDFVAEQAADWQRLALDIAPQGARLEVVA